MVRIKMMLALAPAVLSGTAEAQRTNPRDDLAAVERQIATFIGDFEDLPSEERALWATGIHASIMQWTRFRDAHCDPALLAFESPAGTAQGAADTCDDAVTATIVDDLRFRFQRDGGRPRASATAPGQVPLVPAREEDGPCVQVDPGECDYCGANACWDKRLKADEAALKASWQRAQEHVRASGLRREARADWSERLRKAQEAWTLWRDGTCQIERWETPNRFARSIYSGLVAPCIERETLARIAWLDATYR